MSIDLSKLDFSGDDTPLSNPYPAETGRTLNLSDADKAFAEKLTIKDGKLVYPTSEIDAPKATPRDDFSIPIPDGIYELVSEATDHSLRIIVDNGGATQLFMRDGDRWVRWGGSIKETKYWPRRVNLPDWFG